MELREPEKLARLELLHQHDGAAARERGEHADQGRVRIERRRDQGDRVRAIAEQSGAPDVQPAHAVRLIDALGRARRAGGIDDVEGPVGSDLDRPRLRAVGREPSREGFARAAVVERDPRAVERRSSRMSRGSMRPRTRARRRNRRSSPRDWRTSTTAPAGPRRFPRATRRGRPRGTRPTPKRRSRSRCAAARPRAAGWPRRDRRGRPARPRSGSSVRRRRRAASALLEPSRQWIVRGA